MNDLPTKDLMLKLYVFLESKVEIPKVRVRKRQASIETLITEETLLFANFFRNEHKPWTPRVGAML